MKYILTIVGACLCAVAVGYVVSHSGGVLGEVYRAVTNRKVLLYAAVCATFGGVIEILTRTEETVRIIGVRTASTVRYYILPTDKNKNKNKNKSR